MTARTIHFDGPCPFLMCFQSEAHDHPICPKCGAVRYGNLFCDECREQHDKQPDVIETTQRFRIKHADEAER